MKNLPLEKQVCALDQAKKLAELLGDHAPESYWIWCGNRYQKGVWLISYEDYKEDIVITDTIQNKKVHSWYTDEYWNAYTGDELGALFKNAAKWNEYPCYSTAQEKATLAIEGLTEGWIKPEEFKYE